MNREIQFSSKFRKDYELVKRRGYNMSKLSDVMKMISDGTPLPAKYREHHLKGNFKDCLECHIEPDWLLIYRVEKHLISFERSGTHSDLFKK